MSKKILLIIVVIFSVSSFLAGFFSGKIFFTKNTTNTATNNQNTFSAGWEAAKKRLNETKICDYLGNEEVKTVTGVISAVKSGVIELKINPLEPLSDPKLDIRTVMVDENTKIYKMEVSQNQNDLQPNENLGDYPEEGNYLEKKYEKIEISLTDLKPGDNISVSSAANIKDSKTINAEEVDAQ